MGYWEEETERREEVGWELGCIHMAKRWKGVVHYRGGRKGGVHISPQALSTTDCA